MIRSMRLKARKVLVIGVQQKYRDANWDIRPIRVRIYGLRLLKNRHQLTAYTTICAICAKNCFK